MHVLLLPILDQSSKKEYCNKKKNSVSNDSSICVITESCPDDHFASQQCAFVFLILCTSCDFFDETRHFMQDSRDRGK